MLFQTYVYMFGDNVFDIEMKMAQAYIRKYIITHRVVDIAKTVLSRQ